MAKNQPLLKNPRMPPKPPRIPKSPVKFNYRQKPQAPRPFNCVCVGGPMDGQKIPMHPSNPLTIVFNLCDQRGRYRMESHFEGEMAIAQWEAI